jgi:hypothetical protein
MYELGGNWGVNVEGEQETVTRKPVGWVCMCYLYCVCVGAGDGGRTLRLAFIRKRRGEKKKKKKSRDCFFFSVYAVRVS